MNRSAGMCELKFPKGIEGDYIETKDDLYFDVKGLLHPDDKKIAFIRFYPDPNGDRIKNGINYKKIYDLNQRYDFLRQNYPKYLYHSERMGLELQAVPNDKIKTINSPRDYFKAVSKKQALSRIEKSSLELCELFIEEGGVPKGAIGVTGSPMIGLNKQESDIDLVLYGTEVSLTFQEYFKEILTEGSFCREYNLQEYQTHYEWRAGGSGIPFDTFLACERRKRHQGMYKGFDFFIRYIKSPEDWGGQYHDYRYEDFGRIKLEAKIDDSTDSIFTPCSYKITVLRILDGSHLHSAINKVDILEVNSFRGRFCEHAVRGESVLVEGKLEKVTFKNEKEYYRILLNDQVLDKMIVK